MDIDLLNHLRVVPDFPISGINFYDIQSILEKPEIWNKVVGDLSEKVKQSGADVIVGIESRGFITGVPVAGNLGLPFIMIRKPGKLPGEVVEQEYALEYGTDKIEIQKGFISSGVKVAILDDLMATGGTMKAACDLVGKIGGEVVLCSCIIELPELGGAKKLDCEFEALLQAPLDPEK